MRADEVPDPADARDRPAGTHAEPAGAAARDEPGPAARDAPPAGSVDADELIAEYDEERPGRRLSPGLDRVVVGLCFLTSLFVLWQVFAPLQRGNQYYLVLFLAAVLPLVFVCYRPRRRPRSGERDDPGPLDWVLAGLALLVALYPVLPFGWGDAGGGFDAFLDRQGSLSTTDIVMGALLTLLVLEACRRTTGPVMPIICVAFFLYAYYGGFLPISWPISHAGFDFSQIINGFYNDQSGIYGIPLDVCATYIVLFTIYGAVLDATGAGRFFIDISFATFRRSRSAPGRTVTLSGFLLGTVSGSGTATAVSLGSVAWPVLQRAGYPREQAGGMLAAAGIGAILSPPTLGAAAFIIAEYVGVPYLQVLLWATIPTLLYYAGILLAVEIDARRFGARAVAVTTRPARALLLRFGYHFLSLVVIVVFLALGIAPFRAVVYATLVAAVFGLVERAVSRRDPLDPDAVRRSLPRALREYAIELYQALALGVRAVLPVASVCAAAGIITSVIVKTGLGQSLADLLVAAARALATDPTAVLILTALFAAVAIAVLGLAVPVTASFIISWVIIGPALQTARRQPARGRHVHLLLRGAVRGDAADGAGGGRRGGDHRRQHDRDDVAGVEVHAARVPRPDRLRHHRERIAPAHAGRRLVDRLDHGGVAASRSPLWPRSPEAGSSARPPGCSGCSACRPRSCCSTCSRSPSASAWLSSSSPSSRTSITRQRTARPAEGPS